MSTSHNISDLVRPETGGTVEFGEEQLIFPVNVHESLAASGSLKKNERNGIIISFWVFGCCLLAWFLAGFLRGITPRYYVILTIGVELLLQGTVGVMLLRIILDESTAAMELSKQNNSFARYFGVYHEIRAAEGTKYPFDVMEFADGSYGVYIQLLLGYNTDNISTTTYEINKLIQRTINKAGIEHRVLFSNERFSASKSAEKMRSTIAGISDPKLFAAYREVVQGLLETANAESNVVCATYILYAKTQIQKDELTRVVELITTAVNTADSVYREVNVLEYPEIVEFYRIYYKLDIIDMGLIRVHQVQKKRAVCPIKVLKVYGESGKIYSTDNFSKLQQAILDSDGLKQAN